MKTSADRPRLIIDGTPHYVEDGILHLCADERALAELPLAPIIDGQALTVTSWEVKAGEIVGNVRSGGAIHLGRKGGHLAYWIEGSFGFLGSVVYFPGALLHGCRQHRFTPAHAGEPSGLEPRDIVFSSEHGWWGICLPGNLPLAATKMQASAGRLEIELRHCVASNTRGNLPAAYIATQLAEPGRMLEIDAALCSERKDAGARQPFQEWWGRPVLHIGAGPDDPHTTADLVRSYHRIAAEATRPCTFNVCINAPWYDRHGDCSASLARFGGTEGMRRLIDDLHEAGSRVILWFAPFIVDFASDIAATQPDCLLADKSGACVQIAPSCGSRDFTSAVARNSLLNNVRYMLDSAERCLDADGLRIDLAGQEPTSSVQCLKNPRWGAGAEYWANVLRHIHEDAHRIKPECMIAAAEMMPSLAHHTDMLYFGRDHHDFIGRADLALRLMPGTPIDSGGWGLTGPEAESHWMTSAVVGVPVVGASALGEGGDESRQPARRRLAAAWAAYANAPHAPGMQIACDLGDRSIRRTCTSGEMAGHPAAMSLGGICLATFSPQRAVVVAAEQTQVTIPLHAKPRKVEAVGHDGSRSRHPYSAAGSEICLIVPDAAGDVRYIEITF